jgi:hypothetical protein
MAIGLQIGKSPRAKALATVKEMDAHAAKWAAERDSARSDLAALEATLGEDALAFPVAAAQLPARMTALRDRADIAQRAVEAATGKGLVARRSAVAAEAEEMGPGIVVARDALEAHESRTAALLRALEAHTGESYTPESAMPYDAYDQGPRTVGTPARWALMDALEALQRARSALLAVADGRDPRQDVPGIGYDQLPASIRPGGLLPAPGFAEPVDPQVGFWAELEEAEARLDVVAARVEELQSEAAAERPRIGVQVELAAALKDLKGITVERDNIAGYVTVSPAL